MTYLSVSDFKHGINRLRPQVAGVPGSLWNAKNCVLSRGGDIEAAKKFVGEYALPAGDTFGLASLNGRPYVFGTGATPAGMPTDIAYHKLTYTGLANLVEVHDAKPFGGKMYVVTEFDDGDVRHFYNGAEVTEWQTVADGLWDYTTVAKRLAQKINGRSDVSATAIDNRVKVTAVEAGTAFTISTATVDDANVAGSAPTATKTTLQANVVAVEEVRATATLTVTGGSSSAGVNYVSQITVDGHDLLPDPVDFVLSDAATASAIALAITSGAVAGYSASAADTVVTILAPPGLGATINSTDLTITVGGDVTTTHTAFAGGVTAVEAAAQIESVAISATSADALDTWKITVNGTTYLVTGRSSATGTFIHVYARRVWSPVGSVIRYCKQADPTVWSTMASVAATDPGFIDTSQDSEGSEDIVSIAEHNGSTGFFSDTNIRIYALDPDATAIRIVQPIDNTGSIARDGPLQYHNSDLYYMGTTGLSALRSRLGSSYSSVVDVGSAISPYLLEFVEAVGESVARNAAAVIEPTSGCYMLAISNKVFVLADFPDSGVSGWTEIDLAFTVEQFKRIGRRVMARSGDTIYVYGGVSGDVYPSADDNITVDVECPFLTASDPAGKKDEGGFDMAGSGTWLVELRVDPNDTAKVVTVGHVSKITYPRGAVRVPIQTTHVAPHFTCSNGGKVTLSSFALHYERGETS